MFKNVDKIFLTIVLLLIFGGVFIFASAALGIFEKGVETYLKTILKQIIIGLFIGLIAMRTITGIHYKNWQRFALPFFLTTIALSLLVFVPQVGVSTLGARRWINLGLISFQPSELLKLGFIVYFANWLSLKKDSVSKFGDGFLRAFLIILIPTIILVSQPDNGTLLSIFAAATAMFLIAGGKWQHFLLLVLFIFLGFLLVIYFRPYAMARVTTFLDPSSDPLGAGYQIRQALIAIGSGGLTGRGFGQSIQKFNFLPEPLGDAIFAVAAEEFGFVGSVSLIFLFLGFTLRGLRIGSRAPDLFSRLLAVGIVILIASQSFVNIGAMLGILPLTGVPLLFISHGGTALLMALIEVGVVLNISKFSINK